jgi:hypothetical protein
MEPGNCPGYYDHHPTIINVTCPNLPKRVSELGQHQICGLGPFPSRVMLNGPFRILGVVPFGAYRDAQFWNYPFQRLLIHEDGIT